MTSAVRKVRWQQDVIAALQIAGGNQSRAARLLGVHRNTVGKALNDPRATMQNFDLLVRAVATPVVLKCRECSEEFCAIKDSPATREKICLNCYAEKWLKENRGVNYRVAGMFARFAQSIMVQKYLPYIPKIDP